MAKKFKINTLEIKSFRGIPHHSFDLDNKSLVICGPNGSGKSSITQAFEYLFTGQVSSLKGIRGLKHDEAILYKGHSKKDLHVKATFGKNILERSLTTKFDPGKLEPMVNDFKNGSFILNRKKLLSILETRPGERYKQITTLISFEKYDEIEKQLKQTNSFFNTELKNTQEKLDKEIKAICSLYGCEVDEKIDVTLDNVINKINPILKNNSLETVQKETDLEDYIKENKIENKPNLFNIDISTINMELNDLINDYETINLKKLKSTKSLLNILEYSKGYILSEDLEKCPICENKIEKNIVDKLNPKIKEIKEEFNQFDEWKKQKDELIKKLNDLNYELNVFKMTHSQYNIENDLTNLIDSLNRLETFDIKLSEINIKTLEKLNNEIKNLKERYGKDYEELDEIFDSIIRINKIKELQKELKQLKNYFEASEKTFNVFTKVKEKEIEEILNRITKLTSRYYNIIHNDEPISEPDIKLKGSSALNLTLLFDGESHDPRKFSSEGHIDSLGLCIFLAFVKEYNKHNFIIFDDIISTVDLNHKQKVIQLLFDEFKDYKFIITTHNHLWFEQLSRYAKSIGQYNNFNFIEIKGWDKENGPHFSDSLSSKKLIEKLIEENEIFLAGNTIRQYLEDVLFNICSENEIKLPLKPEYDAGNYLNGIKSFKKEYLDKLELKEIYDNVFANLDKVWNTGNLCSHRNESSYDLTIEDINEYKKAVYEFEDAFKCKYHKTKFLKFHIKEEFASCPRDKYSEYLPLIKREIEEN